MRAVIAALLFTVFLDQAVKLLAFRWLERGSVPLGRIGKLQVVRTQIWIVRASHRPNLVLIWALWILGAAALAVIAARLPSSGWFTGMILGASLSHAVETSWRGEICDYVCLRFWPAFDLSDVALTVGAVGIGVGVWI